MEINMLFMKSKKGQGGLAETLGAVSWELVIILTVLLILIGLVFRSQLAYLADKIINIFSGR